MTAVDDAVAWLQSFRDAMPTDDGDLYAGACHAAVLLAALQARTEALRPFADAASRKPVMIGRGAVTRDWTPPDCSVYPAGQITWGAVRAAANALNPTPTEATI